MTGIVDTIKSLKRFLQAKKRRTPPIIIPRAEHTISRAHISKSALKVLYRLKESGYSAYLVGGGVRDLLLDSALKILMLSPMPDQKRYGDYFAIAN